MRSDPTVYSMQYHYVAKPDGDGDYRLYRKEYAWWWPWPTLVRIHRADFWWYDRPGRNEHRSLAEWMAYHAEKDAKRQAHRNGPSPILTVTVSYVYSNSEVSGVVTSKDIKETTTT